jgi:hypothetical protein
MKRILYFGCLLVLAACNNKESTTAQTYPTTPTGLQGIQQSAPATGTTSGDGVALNPAHGQPGHSCDLPVGAPLNSKPALSTTAAQDTTKATPTATNTPNPTPNSKAQRLNPAHGLPGHKCEIPVGAPLT